MVNMFTLAFWKGAAERAIKTFLQTFVAVVVAGLGADAVGVSAGLLDVSWLDALSVSALATILSVATSAGNADFTAGKPNGKHEAWPSGTDLKDIKSTGTYRS